MLGRAGVPVVLGRGRRRLAHVQLSDAKVGSLSTPDRLVPGDGDIPLGRLLVRIVASAYAGAFEIEMVGPRIDDEGYESAIARAITNCDALLAQGPAGTALRGA